MDFPASNLSKFEREAADRFRVFVKFLGLLGPQGALPLATTEEAHGWNLMRDDAFPRFLDILNHRFLQLFFRAWSDARPIGQHDRPESDRFVAYVGIDDRNRIAALPRPRCGARRREASFLRADGAAGQERLAAAQPDRRIVRRRRSRSRSSSAHVSYSRKASARALDATTAGSAPISWSARSVFSVQDKFRVRIFVEIDGGLRRSTCRAAGAASRSPIWCSSMSASSSTGTSSWRSRRARSSRCGFRASASSAGRAGYRRTGPTQIVRTDATRASIRPKSSSSGGAARPEEAIGGYRWPISVLKR